MKKILLIFVLFLGVQSLYAESTAADLLAKKLESVRAFSANFVQEVHDDKGKVVQHSEGVMQMTRSTPYQQALFYWHVLSPSISTMYFRDGKIIIYDPELSQATLKKVDYNDPSMLPLMLLTGDPSQVLDNFSVTLKNKRRFMLQPKAKDKDAVLLGVVLSLSSEGAVNNIQYQLAVGSKTIVAFGNVKVNQPLKKALFFESLPKDTDYVEVK